MPRTLAAAMQTDVAASVADSIRLIELQFGGGTARYTTGAADLSWNGFTWTAIGGEFQVAPVIETADLAGSSTTISLAAVSGAIASTIAGETYIGRTANLYLAHVDRTTRAIVTDPVVLYQGIMSGGWEIREELDTITATVQCVSRLAALEARRGIQCNLVSHQSYYPGDEFFAQSGQQRSQTVTWGKSRVRIG